VRGKRNESGALPLGVGAGIWPRPCGSAATGGRENSHRHGRRSGGHVQDRVTRFPGESGFGPLTSGPRPI
jgi:hypothetical protein